MKNKIHSYCFNVKLRKLVIRIVIWIRFLNRIGIRIRFLNRYRIRIRFLNRIRIRIRILNRIVTSNRMTHFTNLIDKGLINCQHYIKYYRKCLIIITCDTKNRTKNEIFKAVFIPHTLLLIFFSFIFHKIFEF